MYTLATKPIFTTGLTADILDINPKTIINYENFGILQASRTAKGRRIFSKRDLFVLQLTQYLIREKHLTFEGVKFILCLIDNANSQGIDIMNCVLPEEKIKEFRAKANL